MPTQKKKVKKPKEKEEAKPNVSIKQEPAELKPLSGYLDDRLELIRQVFSCVKPKEIKYLLPDFLEGKSNDIIKERCLDELLGISTKRLLSIINNSKCPTDTESSSGNSDVENIEEHISLDEISSDSDVEAKRSAKRSKKAENNKQPEERNGEAKSEKEMTVLELLELQARARAIRSQLALEPVTKIEIESEHEEEGRHGDIDTDDETGQTMQKITAPKKSLETLGSTENGKQLKQENASQQQPRRVRLKRNFRIRHVGDDDDEDEQEVSSNPSEIVREKSAENAVEIVETPDEVSKTVVEKEKSPEKQQPEAEKLPEVEKEDANVQPADEIERVDAEAGTEENTSKDAVAAEAPAATGVPSPTRDDDRESSPEVIPVEASPETLCISSDSEEERLAKERASIFVANIDELDRQAKQPSPSADKPPEDTEPEEGELSEEEEVALPIEITSTAEELQNKETGQEESTDPKTADDEPMETDVPQTEEGEQNNDASVDAQNEDTSMSVPQQETVGKDTAGQSSEIHTLSSGSDKCGTESSDSSSSSSSEEEEMKAEPPKLDNSAQDDEDIVEIHDSGDENLLLEEKPAEEEEKSWNSRWLKSNRVAKVMAASRLGNKVREKLKKKKQKQQAEQQEPPEAPETAQPSPKPTESVVAELPANVELGSVEHYRELVAAQENKDLTTSETL